MEPARPSLAWRSASLTRRWRRKTRKRTATITIMIGPPMNSANVNRQPSNKARMIPSSITRLVLAISNAMAAVKLAPLRNNERARATAA